MTTETDPETSPLDPRASQRAADEEARQHAVEQEAQRHVRAIAARIDALERRLLKVAKAEGFAPPALVAELQALTLSMLLRNLNGMLGQTADAAAHVARQSGTIVNMLQPVAMLAASRLDREERPSIVLPKLRGGS